MRHTAHAYIPHCIHTSHHTYLTNLDATCLQDARAEDMQHDARAKDMQHHSRLQDSCASCDSCLYLTF